MDGTRPMAVVTGASSGIGAELADQLLDRGFDLVVCAEDAETAATALRLRAKDAGEVADVRADLSTAEGVERLIAVTDATGVRPAALVLNAGVGQGGPFVGNALADELQIIDLNITSTVRLAKYFLPGMVERGSGRVLVTSSLAATMPGAFQAVYNASKSFLQSFALALREELKDTGVTVTSAMPGPTETEFFERAGMGDTKIGRQSKDDPAQVAEQALRAMLRGDDKVVAGSLTTKAQEAASKVAPDTAKAALHRRMAEPGSGE